MSVTGTDGGHISECIVWVNNCVDTVTCVGERSGV